MKKVKESGNFLEKIPAKNPAYNWSCDDAGKVTIEIENKGIFNRIAQLVLKKPKITYIHLDEFGSFAWEICDGKTNIIDLGKVVEDNFGDRVQPLYERLAKYFQTLADYGFIKWV